MKKEKNNLILDDKNSLPFDFFEDDFQAEETVEQKNTKKETSAPPPQESAKEESPNDNNIDIKEQKTKKTPKTITKDPEEKKQIPSPTKEKSPSKNTKASSVITYSGSTTGQILQEARVKKDLSIDQVSLSTRIK